MTRYVEAVGIDWGSSSIRLYDLGPEQPVELYSGPIETKSVATGTGEHRRILDRLLAQVSISCRLVVLSGMVTSRHGWTETPYASTPVGLDDLARQAVQVDDHDLGLWFLPGISHERTDGSTDILRGEETQLFGLSPPSADAVGDIVVVLPGTHSKWAVLSNGAVTRFRTFLTGELFDLVVNQSSVGLVIDGQDFDGTAFDEGVDVALDRERERRGLLHELFAVRARGVVRPGDGPVLASYVSGLLIGTEIADARTVIDADLAVRVAGRTGLVNAYCRALTRAGADAVVETRDPAGVGLQRLAMAIGKGLQ